MPKVLTSWKEIAAYVGKGVRTVQRWEQLFAFPVRRPRMADKQVVIAFQEDIDQWLQLQTIEKRREHRGEIENLRARVMFLEAENELLRQQLNAAAIPAITAVEDTRESPKDSISTRPEVATRLPFQPATAKLQKKAPTLRRQNCSHRAA